MKWVCYIFWWHYNHLRFLFAHFCITRHVNGKKNLRQDRCFANDFKGKKSFWSHGTIERTCIIARFDNGVIYTLIEIILIGIVQKHSKLNVLWIFWILRSFSSTIQTCHFLQRTRRDWNKLLEMLNFLIQLSLKNFP